MPGQSKLDAALGSQPVRHPRREQTNHPGRNAFGGLRETMMLSDRTTRQAGEATTPAVLRSFGDECSERPEGNAEQIACAEQNDPGKAFFELFA